ncbi:MAG: DoxX family protein [Chthoniobacterales bacterium]|nr:DoxX family protein [Chthoniobacterales bacterium]
MGASWILAALFFCAGALKLLQPGAFLADIQSFHLLPYPLALAAAYFIPALEIAAATGLCSGRFRLESCLIITALTAVFLVALSSAWIRGLDISCGCFGRSDVQANYPLLIGRNLLILAGCGVIMFFRTRGNGTDQARRARGQGAQ